MKKPKITEGEWTIEKHDHIDGEVWLSVNKGAIEVTHNVRDDQIASQKFSITDPQERIANAQAISAVPDMLEAGIRILKKLRHPHKSVDLLDQLALEKALKKAGCTDETIS